MNMWTVSSKRKYNDGGAHHIIYEWEDVLSEQLKIPIVNSMHPLLSFADKVLRKLHCNFLWIFRTKKILSFQMTALDSSDSYNSRKVIPMIVDFYLPPERFAAFFKAVSRNPIVFISSREVFEKLQAHPCFDASKYYHLPLSLPDKYRIDETSVFEKKYDCVVLGRPDSLLKSFVEKYATKHPDFVYVDRRIEQGKGFTYFTNKGEIILSSNNHDDYVRIMRSGKVGLWSTRGIDEKQCNGYNQVTPRFFELLSSCCRVICRYPKNADTDFFKITEFCPSVETYEDFERIMNDTIQYNTIQCNAMQYSTYLSNHYTSKRSEQLKQILRLKGLL